jgi:hypothetical protein
MSSYEMPKPAPSTMTTMTNPHPTPTALVKPTTMYVVFIVHIRYNNYAFYIPISTCKIFLAFTIIFWSGDHVQGGVEQGNFQHLYVVFGWAWRAWKKL